MSEIQDEIKELKEERKEIENSLALGINDYARLMESGLGEDMIKELKNPTCKPEKIPTKAKLKRWWNDFKNKLNNYLFYDESTKYEE